MRIFLLLALICLCSAEAFPQAARIAVSPFIGEKLTPESRERYGLFRDDPVFAEFSYAEFLLNPDSTLSIYVSRAPLSLPDTVLRRYATLKDFRSMLMEKELAMRVASGAQDGQPVVVMLTDGEELRGELVAARDSGLVVRTRQYREGDRRNYSFAHERDIANIRVLFRPDGGKAILYMAAGGLAGFGAGYATRVLTDAGGTGAKFSVVDLVPALLGAGVGYFSAKAGSPENEVRFSPLEYPVRYLLPYARYYENEPAFLRKVR